MPLSVSFLRNRRAKSHPGQIQNIKRDHDIPQAFRHRILRHKLNRTPKQERPRKKHVFQQFRQSRADDRLHDQERRAHQ